MEVYVYITGALLASMTLQSTLVDCIKLKQHDDSELQMIEIRVNYEVKRDFAIHVDGFYEETVCT